MSSETSSTSSGSAAAPRYVMWLKSTVFDHGILGFPVKGLTFSTIAGVTRKSDAIISKEAFIKAAGEGFNWSDEEASLVFDHFDLLYSIEYESLSSQNVDNTTEEEEGQEEEEGLLSKDSMNLQRRRFCFCLFLALQLYSHRRLRRSSLADIVNAQWKVPSNVSEESGTTTTSSSAVASAAAANSSQQFQNPHQIAVHARSNEWAARLDFVKKSFGSILEMLLSSLSDDMDMSSFPQSIDGEAELAGAITKAAIDSLGFIIDAAASTVGGSTQRRITNLSDLMLQQGEDGETSDFSVGSVEEVIELFVANLTINEEYNMRWTDDSQNSTTKNVKDSTKPLLIRGSGRRSILLSEETQQLQQQPQQSLGTDAAFAAAIALRESRNQIRNHAVFSTCKGTTIYFLQPCNYVHIVGCLDTTIILGPVFGAISAEHCERVNIIVPCGRLRVNNCVDMKVNYITNQSPILFGDCRNISVAPHNINYPKLREHLNRSKFDYGQCKWMIPIIIDMASGISSSNTRDSNLASVFSVLSPDLFEINNVPLALTSKISKLSSYFFPLPSEYEAALIQRRKTILELVSLLQGASKIHGEQVQSAIQSAFKDWLISTGNVRHIMDLVRLEEQGPQIPSTPVSSSATVSTSNLGEQT